MQPRQIMPRTSLGGAQVIRRFPVIFNFLAAIIVLIVLIAAPVFGQVPQSPPGFQFSSDGASLHIPVEVVADGLVLVQVKANDSPGWFIVDNGTQGFVVDRAYAKRNSLQSSGSAVTSGRKPSRNCARRRYRLAGFGAETSQPHSHRFEVSGASGWP